MHSKDFPKGKLREPAAMYAKSRNPHPSYQIDLTANATARQRLVPTFGELVGASTVSSASAVKPIVQY